MTYSIYNCEFQKDKLSEKNETLNWEGEYRYEVFESGKLSEWVKENTFLG